jgi:hypothetical protein
MHDDQMEEAEEVLEGCTHIKDNAKVEGQDFIPWWSMRLGDELQEEL